MRWKAAVLLFCLVFLVYPYTRPRYGGKFRISFPVELSLKQDLSWESLFYQSLLYANLFILESDGRLRSYIFDDWKMVDEGWKFKLRKPIYFHDGTPILARHIRDSILAFLKTSMPGAFSLARIIASVEVLSEREILVRTTQECNLPRLLSNPYLFIREKGKFSGPFYPQDDYLVANPFFPEGRPFLDKISFVYPSSDADLINFQKDGFILLPEKKFIVYLLVSPSAWPSKMARRCIYSIFVNSGLWERVDSYFLPEFTDFSLDFPVESRRTIKKWIRRRVKLAIPSKLAFLQGDIEHAFSRMGVKVLFIPTEDPVRELKQKTANAALLYSTAIALEKEPKELAELILRYHLPYFFRTLSDEVDKLQAAVNLDEESQGKILAAAYEKIASREFFFPVAILKSEWYASPAFEGFKFDYYNRLLLYYVRKKLLPLQ